MLVITYSPDYLLGRDVSDLLPISNILVRASSAIECVI